MASIAQIDAAINAAVTASKSEDFRTALLRIQEAGLLIMSVPSREFDGQKVSYDDKAEMIKTLTATYTAMASSKQTGNGGLKNFPVVRAYRES